MVGCIIPDETLLGVDWKWKIGLDNDSESVRQVHAVGFNVVDEDELRWVDLVRLWVKENRKLLDVLDSVAIPRTSQRVRVLESALTFASRTRWAGLAQWC